MPTPSPSGYPDVLVSVSGGYVRVTVKGESTWTTPASVAPVTDPPLNTSGIVYGRPLNQKLHLVDGTNLRYLDYPAMQVKEWAATAGTIPTDDAGNKPRLVEAHAGRIVVSGILDKPQKWGASKFLDAFDWDLAPASKSSADAVDGATAEGVGEPGDVIHSLASWRDDVFLWGCRQSIYQLVGDFYNGRMTRITEGVGFAWGRPWVITPDGTLWFFAQEPGVYTMTPGSTPVFRSQSIQKYVRDLDTDDTLVTMGYDRKRRSVHVFCTPLTTNAAATHLAFETQTGSWWCDRFADPGMNPLATTNFEGNLVFGGWDGVVRRWNDAVATDDGLPFTSTVMVGPILTKLSDSMFLREIQASLGAGSGGVTYEILVGSTPEEALASPTVLSGEWVAGRNPNDLPFFSGQAVYIRLTTTNRWAYESVRAMFAPGGPIRRRML